MSPLQAAKHWTVANVGLAKDALHISVALALFFGGCAVFGWRVGDWKPLALVTVAAIAGELWDLRDSIVYATPMVLRANWHDVWNTMFWPSAITLLVRGRLIAMSGDRLD